MFCLEIKTGFFGENTSIFLYFQFTTLLICSDLTLPVGENGSRSELVFANRAWLK